MAVVKAILSVAVVFLVSTFSFARLMGQGEVTGEITASWLSGDHVVFYLNISSQNNEHGPVLASPNKFAYAGPDKMELTAGDIIRLRYDSDDSYGIHVEGLEFVENKAGTVPQGYGTVWIMLPIVALAAAGILIFAWLRRRRVTSTG